jgi:2-dehydro-3-deoxygluconokinase
MMKIACIGECMIELTQTATGDLHRGFGGDTLNTAIYLARLGANVDYITALGDDPWSDEMVAAWTAESIGVRPVLQIAGKLPGLYVIETSADGERRFYYWRDNSAARLLLDVPETDAVLKSLSDYDLIYLSGITLSLYGVDGCARLIDALKLARKAGCRIAFDTNFRPRGWPDRTIAQRAFQDAFAVADIVLASVEDLDLLFGEGAGEAIAGDLTNEEVVLKLNEPACRVRTHGIDRLVSAAPVERVIDTTAAGDSFSAAYLAVRLSGSDPFESAKAGHRLAGVVVGHRGAIIPRGAMSSFVESVSFREATA